MRKILNFGTKKNIFEAIIFYILWAGIPYLFLVLIDTYLPEISRSFGRMLGLLTATALPFIVSFSILNQKKLSNKPVNVFIIFLSMILGLFVGLFIGMLPSIYLTTLDRKK